MIASSNALAHAPILGDMNSDGRVDVVLYSNIEWPSQSSNPRLAVLRNEGGLNFSNEETIFAHTSSVELASMVAADVNYDGLMDVVRSHGHPSIGVALDAYLQGPPGVFSILGIGLQQANSAIVARDVDHDGYVDLVLARTGGSSCAADSVSLLMGSAVGLSATEISIAGGCFLWPHSPVAADVNADGLEDIFFARRVNGVGSHQIWLAQSSSGQWATAATVVDVAPTTCPWWQCPLDHSFGVGDVDADGFADLVQARALDSKIVYFPGDGSGGFGAEQVVATGWPTTDVNHPVATLVHVADFDMDGIADVVCGSASSVFVRSLGAGVFDAPQALGGTTVVGVADLDGDVDLDLLAGQRGGGCNFSYCAVHVIENLTPDCNLNGVPDANEIASNPSLDCNSNGALDTCELALGLATDFDNNGVLDECIAPPLDADRTVIQASSGGVVNLTLDAGPSRALDVFVLLGSASGTQPGLADPVTGLVLQLNYDSYFAYLYSSSGAGILNPFFGFLDSSGRAVASLLVPPLSASFVGLRLDHAYLTIDLFGTGAMSFSSNPVPLTIEGP